MKLLKSLTILSFLTISSIQCCHASFKIKGYEPKGFLDFNTYHDTRNFQVHTLNAKLDLPGPFSYFGFTNWSGNQTGDHAFSYGDHYTEQNLYWNEFIAKPLDLNIQYADANGPRNDVLRTGIQINFHKLKYIEKLFKLLNASYRMTYFAWQVDHVDDYAFQLQHVWYMKILPKLFHERVYMSGFADHNFIVGNQDTHNKLVTETQFGVRVWKGLHAVTELRWNGFLPKGDRFGVGIGLQYKIVF